MFLVLKSKLNGGIRLDKVFNEENKLQQLLEENADIELLFIKYLLDREVTYEKMGDYANQYTQLINEQKWEFARFYKAELNRNMFFWQDFLLSVEIPLQDFLARLKLEN